VKAEKMEQEGLKGSMRILPYPSGEKGRTISLVAWNFRQL